ncbi:MAG TPA: hypothetical protein PLF44_00040 [Candidatus Mcinerneyibacteriales bacterium]|nr:hypothetical protein [Candidatus Mcinerneyibacteriales bacterium]HPE19796.1 hypothetical protein [Candidatus Mcinerneyibacteriales bacterium]HPJ69244.1 hypothetical protein [Candidatus Mcinerneyibacteriales bacterium]HPQ89517.1 hypothetical protein [Candidatus Mcinerneyibacteriales bacterium]
MKKKIGMTLLILVAFVASVRGFDFSVRDTSIFTGAEASIGIIMNEDSDMNMVGASLYYAPSSFFQARIGFDAYEFADQGWKMDEWHMGGKVLLYQTLLAFQGGYYFCENKADYYRLDLLGTLEYDQALFSFNAGFAASTGTNLFPVGIKAKLPVSYTSYLIASGEYIRASDKENDLIHQDYWEFGGGIGWELSDVFILELSGYYDSTLGYEDEIKVYDDQYVRFSALVRFSPQ